jgi:hypothetical protein
MLFLPKFIDLVARERLKAQDGEEEEEQEEEEEDEEDESAAEPRQWVT